ncbi:MAG: phosphate acetyltransferase [Campylobacterota bacterium]|nr:phosphate acetyltransferase [Campylobacterota bacterium]
MKIKSLYIASLEPMAGSLFVTVGMTELLKRRLDKIAFFSPVIECDKKPDCDTVFMLEHFSIDMPYEDTYGFTVDEVESMVADGRGKEVVETLIKKFKQLERNYDFVICEGLNRISFTAIFDFDINHLLAKNFNSPYISILNGKEKESSELIEEIQIEEQVNRRAGVNHFATFVNRIDEKAFDEISQKPPETGRPVYLLPEVEELDRPSVGEVMQTLDCRHIYGAPEDLSREVRQSKIAAMTLENYLLHIEEGDLIIVPGDRADIIITSLAAVYSQKYPHIAGLLLTGGLSPRKQVMKLFKGLNYFPIPILSIETDTYTTAVAVDEVPSRIRPHSDRKIALAMGLFNTHVDIEQVESKLNTVSCNVVTPSMFEFNLFEQARSVRKKIVLPESADDRILQAAEILLRRDVVDIVLLGDPKEIAHKSAMLGLDISRAEIIKPDESPLMKKFTDEFYELRKAKGLTRDTAEDAMMHLTYFATMMVHLGYADGMVSGAIHTTGETIRPALQIIKTRPGISIVSSVFFMCMDTRVLVYGDCAVNQDPNAEELAEIAISSAETAGMFNVDPKIAMLSYSTGDSGTGDDVEKVRKATKIVKKSRPDLLIEGPIQYDAAIEPSVAKKKLPKSDVAGKATIFIFPDLNTGNNTYKAVQRSSGAVAIGPVLQGLKKPVNDLSRGCLVADIVNTVAITAIQAQGIEK